MLQIIRNKAEWERNYARLITPSVLASHDYMTAVEGLEEGGQAELALWCSGLDFIFHPYVRRTTALKNGLYDLVSGYDFGGFWFTTDDAATRQKLLRGFENDFGTYTREKGIVCEFIRFNPFLDLDYGMLTAYRVTHVSDNVIVRFDRPYDEIWTTYHPTLRNKVRQGRKHGLRCIPSQDYSTFVHIYHRNLEWLNAPRYYFFAKDFFERVSEYLNLYLIVDRDGELCGAHTYIRDGDALFAFLCHGVRDKLRLRPNDFGYDEIIRAGADSSHQYFHFGGGTPSLMAYKRKFSPDTAPYYIGRRIFDERAYKELVRLREQRDRICLDTSSFFPKYRSVIDTQVTVGNGEPR